jgi:threonine dehydrogenase-like Zn-dependent dehydrogenase
MNAMKALVFRDIGRIELDEIPVPVVSQPDDVLIKVAMCGVCGTDRKILEGKHVYKKDTVLGHELSGTVVDVGTHVKSVKIGDRVATDNNPRCGVCSFCRTGWSSQCVEMGSSAIGVQRNGGFAEYCLAPDSICHALPAEIDERLGTQVETLAAIVNGMNIVAIRPYECVLVVGFGPIGYLFASLARNAAAKIAVTEIDPFRIDVARKLGLTAWNPHKDDIEEKITAFTYGRKADVVIEAVGTEFENVLRYVAPGGRVIPMGMDSSVRATVVPNDITRHAIKILGLYLGQNTMLPSIHILREARIDTGPYFSAVLPLEEGLRAFPMIGLDLDSMADIPKSSMKIVLDCNLS